MSTMHTAMYTDIFSQILNWACRTVFAQHQLMNDAHVARCCCTEIPMLKMQSLQVVAPDSGLIQYCDNNITSGLNTATKSPRKRVSPKSAQEQVSDINCLQTRNRRDQCTIKPKSQNSFNLSKWLIAQPIVDQHLYHTSVQHAVQ